MDTKSTDGDDSKELRNVIENWKKVEIKLNCFLQLCGKQNLYIINLSI